ncbi:unnamed protein product [Brassica oleracea]
MAKFGLNQLDNGRPNRIKCLGFGNWGNTIFFFSQTRERQRELFCDSSSSSSSILLSHLRFLFLVFDSSSSSLFFFGFSFDSFESSILLRWPETSFCGCGSSQHWHISKTKG